MSFTLLFVGNPPLVSHYGLSELLTNSLALKYLGAVSDPEEAMAEIAKRKPDLLILDKEIADDGARRIFESHRHLIYHLIVLHKEGETDLPVSRFGKTLHFSRTLPPAHLQEAILKISEEEERGESIEAKYQSLMEAKALGDFMMIYTGSEQGPRFVWVAEISLWENNGSKAKDSTLYLKDGREVVCGRQDQCFLQLHRPASGRIQE